MSISIECSRVTENHLGYTRISTTARDAHFQLDAPFPLRSQNGVSSHVTSGSKITASRPAMQKRLDHIEFGDTVVVWGIDRLGRSLFDVLNTVNIMRDVGIVVRSTSDRIDSETSTGRLMMSMLAAAHQSGTRFGRPLRGPTFTRRKLS